MNAAYIPVKRRRVREIPAFLQKDNVYVYDVETFVNCFTVVFRNVKTGAYHKFVICTEEDSRVKKRYGNGDDLNEFLKTRMILIGFNNRGFDDYILEFIRRCYQSGIVPTGELIYEFAQKEVIEARGKPYASTYHWGIDLMAINNYGIFGQFPTSLKWLEFTLRWHKMRDLPLHHSKKVTKSSVSKLVTYNVNDVDVTFDFLFVQKGALETRHAFFLEHGRDFEVFNLPDSQLGERIVHDYFVKNVPSYHKGMEKGTDRKEIKIADCIFDYVKFKSPEFNEVLRKFKSRTISPGKDGKLSLKGVFSEFAIHKGVKFVYGAGGLHACRGAGLYRANEDYVIFSCDVASYYPNLAIKNRVFPEHLSEAFCDVYETIYETRKKIPKSDPNNYLYKQSLNSVYGKSNASYPSFLRDAKYTITTTVNGQLLLTMLAESLSEIGDLIFANTDGIEIRVHRNDVDKMIAMCKDWEKLTQLTLEYDTYDLIVARDVNNYLSIFESGKTKRKGYFETYEDITEIGGGMIQYHKNPSASIIPIALNAYYTKGEPVSETIINHPDIYDFLVGIKGKTSCYYTLMRPDDQGRVSDIQKMDDRAIRYYLANDGYTMFKMYRSGKKAGDFQGVNVGQMISPLMDIKDDDLHPENYPDLNYDWYIEECEQLINELQNSQFNLL